LNAKNQFLFQDKKLLNKSKKLDKRICYAPGWTSIIHIKNIAVAVVQLSINCVVVGKVDSLLEVPLLVEVDSDQVRAHHVQIDRLAVTLRVEELYECVHEHRGYA